MASLSVLTLSHMIGFALSVCSRLQGLPAGHLVQRSDFEDLEGGPSAAEGQCGTSLTECSHLLFTLVDVVVMVVIVQLCVSDGVEDLMESLTVESEKSLTSQEPDSLHGVGSTAEHLQGEMTPDLSQWTDVRGDQVSAVTPRLLSPFRPRLRRSSGLDCCPSDSAAGVFSRQPADQEC